MSELHLQVVESSALSDDRYREIVALCNAAYRQDLTELMATFGPRTHVLGFIAGELVTHAMWVTRWLQVAGGQSLKGLSVFLTGSDVDEWIEESRTRETARVLQELGADVEMRIYKGRKHVVSADELSDARAFLAARLQW